MRKYIPIAALFLVLLVSIGLQTPCYPAQETSSPYSEAIKAYESFVIKHMALDRIPGLSIGFMKDDFIWTEGFGFADLENMVPAKPESSYRLASITKTITAIAVLKLAEAGKIDLDAEVQTYVPYFPRKKWPVTVRLLLGHLAGISHYRNYEVEGHIKVHKNTKEALAIFQDFDLIAQPGNRYYYSSYGFNLLGAVVEGASGMPYGQYIKEHIFEPLGMKDTRMDDPVNLIPNRVRGYRLIDGEIKNSEYVDVSSRFAGGGTRSTVVNLLKYAKGIMEGKILTEETWRKMFTSMATKGGFLTGYGMGWNVRPMRGHFMVGHSGSQPETRTLLLIFPTERFAIALASNLEGMNRMFYAQRLAELVLDEDIDGTTYVNDKEVQLIHDACFDVFSYGMSQYDWQGLSFRGKEDLEEAFTYFNTYVDLKALKNNFEESRKKIKAGIHPLSQQAFTNVGTHMAYTLSETLGKERLKSYSKSGPIPFFSDYIKISKTWSSQRKNFRFKKSFVQLISKWEKDWSKVYPDSISRLFISVDTDFNELGERLKRTFAGAAIYPNFSEGMIRVAHHFLEENETEKSFNILNLNAELYPHSPLSVSGLAEAHLWIGNNQEARSLLRKAYLLNPSHPSVSMNAIFNLASRLEQAGKMDEVIVLMDIATELYPRNARLYKEIGDMYLRFEQKKKAAEFYRKALIVNPNYKEAKEKLEKMERESHDRGGRK